MALLAMVLGVALLVYPDEITIRVWVVDAAGHPCAGMPVSLVTTPVLPASIEPGFADHLDRYLKTARTDDAGEVAFAHAEEELRPEEGFAFAVRLAIPQRERRQESIPTEPLRSLELTLVKPPTGSVVFSAPGCEGDTVLLRAVSRDGMGAIPNGEDPCRVVVTKGRAEFAAVEVGTRLAYQVDVGIAKGPAPSGRLDGPTSAGEVVYATVPWASEVPVIAGRILREDRVPVANAPLRFRLPRNSAVLTTDGNGGFSLPVFETPEDKAAMIEILSDSGDPASQSAVGDASAARMLPRKLPAGRYDLGDVTLERPGSMRVLETLDDDALEHAYQERRELCYANGRFQPLVEACLLEMARRWHRALAAVPVGRARARRAANRDFEHRRVNEGEPLEYLIALRRARGKPDPLAITIAGSRSVFEAEFRTVRWWPAL